MRSAPAFQTLAGTLFATIENNTDFRMLLLRHCKNGMLMSGILAISVTLLYIFIKVMIFGHSVSWSYEEPEIKTVVLWDKVFIIIISITVIVFSRLKISLGIYRALFIFLCLTVAFAILSDDILNQDVNFSSGYLTILLLIAASCIPFKPWQTFILCSATVLMLFPGLYYMSDIFFGVEGIEVKESQVVHLSIISIILVGVSWFLYHSRYTMYMARKKADDFVDTLYGTGKADNGIQEFINEQKLIQNNLQVSGQQWVSNIDVPSADQVFLDKVKAAIEKHIGDSNFGVEWLAHEAAISPRQLQRRLKSSIGISAGGLIRIMRMQRAAQLLKQNAGNISEISHKIGFSDPVYFSRIFRKMYGQSPSDFIKSNKIT
jgi:AraC-like DNA-binding protein